MKINKNIRHSITIFSLLATVSSLEAQKIISKKPLIIEEQGSFAVGGLQTKNGAKCLFQTIID